MPRPTLKQRADGRYKCKYKGRVFYGKSSKEAYAKLDAYKIQEAQGLRHEAAGITVAEYAEAWLPAHKSECTARTYDGYQAQINRMNALIGHERIRDITQTDIRLAFNSVHGCSKSTVHKFTMIVRGIFRSALADRLILSDPCIDVRTAQADAGTHRAVTEHERELIRNTSHRMRPAVMTMLYAGLRRGEALALDIDRDIDFTAKTITVRGGIRYDSNQPIHAKTKTKTSTRVVPMPDILVDELQGRHGLLMPAANKKTMSQQAFRRAWASYMSALSVTENGCSYRWAGGRGLTPDEREQAQAAYRWVDIDPHDLRHTCITMWYNAGVDVLTCSHWAGHADVTTTMRIYTHLTDEHEQAAKMSMISAVNLALGVQTGVQQANATPANTGTERAIAT